MKIRGIVAHGMRERPTEEWGVLLLANVEAQRHPGMCRALRKALISRGLAVPPLEVANPLGFWNVTTGDSSNASVEFTTLADIGHPLWILVIACLGSALGDWRSEREHGGHGKMVGRITTA